MANHKDKLIEITRSFSYKLNIGGYQTADFFCSKRAEVPEKESEEKSKELYEFCKNQIGKAILEFKAELVDVDKVRKAKEWNIKCMKSDVEFEEAKSEIKGQAFREGKEKIGH